MKFLDNEEGNIAMVGAVVGILITLMIAVLVFYNVAASIDTTEIDADILDAASTPAANATEATIDQSETFFTIAPIVAIVIVAVVILGYVSRIG